MKKNESKIKPIYFFYGPETYLINEETQILIDRTLSPKERRLNLEIFNAPEKDIYEIVQAAKTIPMFSRYRFVIINDADLIPEENIEILINYFENPSPTTCMVLRGKELGKWKAYKSKIENFIEIREYQRLKGRSLILWVISKMEAKGKILSEDIAQYLIDWVGNNLQDIDNILEMIDLSSDYKKKVEWSDIEGIVSDVKAGTIFDLMDAIGRKDLDKAFKILKKSLESKTISFKKDEGSKRFDEPGPVILAMMARQYWNMLEIKKLSHSINDQEELKKRLGISTWSLKKLLEQEKNFSEASLLVGIMNCHNTDLAIKKGKGQKEIFMEKLLIDLCKAT